MQLASSFRQDFGNSRVQCSAVRTAVLTALYGGFSLRRFLGHKPHFSLLGAGLNEGECLSQLRLGAGGGDDVQSPSNAAEPMFAMAARITVPDCLFRVRGAPRLKG